MHPFPKKKKLKLVAGAGQGEVKKIRNTILFPLHALARCWGGGELTKNNTQSMYNALRPHRYLSWEPPEVRRIGNATLQDSAEQVQYKVISRSLRLIIPGQCIFNLYLLRKTQKKKISRKKESNLCFTLMRGMF
jgi:hypothetical protein